MTGQSEKLEMWAEPNGGTEGKKLNISTSVRRFLTNSFEKCILSSSHCLAVRFSTTSITTQLVNVQQQQEKT